MFNVIKRVALCAMFVCGFSAFTAPAAHAETNWFRTVTGGDQAFANSYLANLAPIVRSEEAVLTGSNNDAGNFSVNFHGYPIGVQYSTTPDRRIDTSDMHHVWVTTRITFNDDEGYTHTVSVRDYFRSIDGHHWMRAYPAYRRDLVPYPGYSDQVHRWAEREIITRVEVKNTIDAVLRAPSLAGKKYAVAANAFGGRTFDVQWSVSVNSSNGGGMVYNRFVTVNLLLVSPEGFTYNESVRLRGESVDGGVTWRVWYTDNPYRF